MTPIFDSHVHIGQYFETYYSVPRVLRTLKCAGITHFAYSSTTPVICDDPGVLREERQAVRELFGKRAFPLLWISHSMLERSRDLSLYLDADICGFKVHGVSERWEPNGKELHHVFSIARERNFPVMFHTGEHEECLALSYQRICLRFPTVRVILAHGRPLDQTIKMLQTCPNAYVDTAFMPHEHLKILLENRFEKRILFGTDTPIPGRYIQSSLPRHLRTRIATSQKICGKSWKQIGFQNAKELFR
jgi:uncharacterized protein